MSPKIKYRFYTKTNCESEIHDYRKCVQLFDYIRRKGVFTSKCSITLFITIFQNEKYKTVFLRIMCRKVQLSN